LQEELILLCSLLDWTLTNFSGSFFQKSMEQIYDEITFTLTLLGQFDLLLDVIILIILYSLMIFYLISLFLFSRFMKEELKSDLEVNIF